MNRRQPLRALLWDLDGTLVDTTPIHREAFDQLYDELGLPPVPYEQIAGQPTEQILSERGLSGPALAQAVRRKQRLARERMASEPILCDGARETLAWAADAGLRQALVTGASRGSVRLVLERYGLEELFHATICAGETPRGKPAGDPYAAGCAALDVFPAEALAIEDADNGVRSAEAAGVEAWTVHVTGARYPNLARVRDALADARHGGGSPVRFVDQGADGASGAGCVAVVPAAGRGTRLAADGPKVLYEIEGLPILAHLCRQLAEAVEAIVVIVSPDGQAPIEQCAAAHGLQIETIVQPRPVGMANAVWSAHRCPTAASAERLLIVWGDQVTLRGRTVRALITQHADVAADASLATHIRRDPYIHFDRDRSGRLNRVLQRREGDPMPPLGENDCGLFLVDNQGLFDRLGRFAADQTQRGAVTGEVSFLPFLLSPDAGFETVLCLRGIDRRETVGVNTIEEARAAASFLREQAGP